MHWNVHKTSNINKDSDVRKYTLKSKLQNMTGVSAAGTSDFYFIQSANKYTRTTKMG